MSGRSAYVRKKITETKPGEKSAADRSRAKSAASSEDNATISDYPMPGSRQDTGVATTNARFLKFSEPVRESEVLNYRSEITSYGNQSSGSQSGGSVDGRRDAAGTPHFRGPLEDFAYARARRPVIKTEDVSGIEKSGLRNMLDKKSDEVRKGLAKTFAFRKKDKKSGADVDRGLEFRPQSSATVRPGHGGGSSGAGGGYPSDADIGPDPYNPETLPVQYHQQLAAEQPWDSSGIMMAPPPSSKLPPLPPSASAPPIKRWIGGGRPVQRWNKLRKDPELWDPNGDVLVFFGHRGQGPRPNPSFRLSSHIIEATESRYLITLLREGSTEEDINMPPSPMGAPPMLHRHGHYAHHHLSPHNSGYGRNGQPTPPISEDVSLGEADGQISYEMYFPTPPNMSNTDQLRQHITTRNVFALLYHASLVGLSLYQALFDLHSRLETYMPPEADNVGTILNYLSARGIDDVRNDPETAVSLLAWSEGNEVRWEEGWRESFLHCAGMYSRLESCADFKNITPITRALLERASLETQLRVQAAEERLAEFQFEDMWPASVGTTASTSGPVTASPAKGAADRLQKFLVQHYSQVFGQWPPLPAPQGHEAVATGTAYGSSGGDSDGDIWLTRTIAQALQKDFAALYDYIVNRDIVWDGSEARSSRKWMMVSLSGNRSFEADTPDLPMTDMLIEFDNKLRFPHIPHPYALVPESIPPLINNSSASGKDSSLGGGMFGSGRSSKKASNGANGNGNSGRGRPGAVESRIQLAYTEATNICLLGSDFTHSDLIEAFSKFEKTDRIGEIDPSIARRGRWVLIYGILQILASVSVDAPNVRYRDGVPYHLSPRLKGAKMPPWKTGGPSHIPNYNGPNHKVVANRDEAAHELSHCWVVPRAWNDGTNGGSSAANSGAESSADELSGTGPTMRSYSFPRPPGSMAGRSSVAGYHTPAGMGAKSVISSTASNYSQFSSAGSLVSESDTASSVRTPASNSSRKGSATSRRRRDGGGLRVPRGIERVDEHDREWPVRGESYTTTTSSNAGVSGMGSYQGYQLAPLKVPGNLTRPGGFLMMDDVADEQNSLTTAASTSRSETRRKPRRDGRGPDSVAGTFGRPGAAGNGGNGSETGSTAPVIRDFDDFDMIDDHRL
jgi:hypothetical protein